MPGADTPPMPNIFSGDVSHPIKAMGVGWEETRNHWFSSARVFRGSCVQTFSRPSGTISNGNCPKAATLTPARTSRRYLLASRDSRSEVWKPTYRSAPSGMSRTSLSTSRLKQSISFASLRNRTPSMGVPPARSSLSMRSINPSTPLKSRSIMSFSVIVQSMVCTPLTAGSLTLINNTDAYISLDLPIFTVCLIDSILTGRTSSVRQGGKDVQGCWIRILRSRGGDRDGSVLRAEAGIPEVVSQL